MTIMSSMWREMSRSDESPSRIDFAERSSILDQVWAEFVNEDAINTNGIPLLSAIATKPHDPVAWYQLADYCRSHFGTDTWLAVLSVALRCDHQSYEAIYRRGCAKILLGDWSGWVDREARHHKPSYCKLRPYPVRDLVWKSRAWNGIEDIGDRTLLIVDEQGFGDNIQMYRFIPALAQKARRVMVRSHPALADLISHNFGHVIDVFLADATDRPAFDRYVWIMALPAVCGLLPEFTPLTSPRPMMRTGAARRIGLCWAGSAAYPDDRNRSLPLAAFETVLSLEHVEWYSLQVGERASDVERYPGLFGQASSFSSFAETADFIGSLDAVVTCDTSIAHLAGSLGAPTFLLLQRAAVWRWGLKDTTSWYPSMRIIRQTQPGDWSLVMTDLRQLLIRDLFANTG
jgi:hypothetical protein